MRTTMAIVGIAAALAAAAGIGVRASYGAHVTGDEPQYLITALSIAEDRSLDVSDEIAEIRYLPFHEIALDRQTRPLEGGREVSPHDPLLPALLALPMALGGWIAAKAALGVLAGVLAALMVWIAVRRFDVPVARAAPVVGVLAVSAPSTVYGHQIYPELPAALAVAVVLACATGGVGRAALAGIALGVIALPWLSVKYSPVAAVLAALVLVQLWRVGRPRAALSLVLAWSIAAALFAAAHLAWYGGLTPYGTGDHFVSTGEFGVVGSSPNYAGRSVRLIGLMVDDRFGLAAWQPAWLLLFPAVAALVRARPPGGMLVAGGLAAGWLTATFVALTMQGWWWPGRQVVVVLPLGVVALAWWAGTARSRTLATVALGVVGASMYAWLVVEGLAGRITWVVDFYSTANPTYRVWSALLPDYLDVTAATWALHAAWIVVAAALALWGWRRTGMEVKPPFRYIEKVSVPG